MKATEQFFYVVLFTMLYKVFLTFRSVDETNQMMATEQYFSCGTGYYTVQGGASFKVCI